MMDIQADKARLALLIVFQQATQNFTDQGAIALLHWYVEFCVSKGKNIVEPLDLSGTGLLAIPNLVRLPLAFGIPCLKLGHNPNLVDLSELQDLPLSIKLGTLEQGIIAETSAPKILLMHEIRNLLLTPKTRVELKLEQFNVDEIPVYLQLLSGLKELDLGTSSTLKNLRTINHFSALQTLQLSCFYKIKNLTELTNLPKLENLWIKAMSRNREILYGIENIPSLEEIYLYGLGIDNIDNLKNMPNLKKVDIICCNNLQWLPRVNEFPILKEIKLYGLENLQAISFEEKNNSLERINISTLNRLVSVTGINNLVSLKKIRMIEIENLQIFDGIEDAIQLEYFEFSSNKLELLKQKLKYHINSGRYGTFKKIDCCKKTSINIFNYQPENGKEQQLLLLTHHLASLEFPWLPKINFTANLSSVAGSSKENLLSFTLAYTP